MEVNVNCLIDEVSPYGLSGSVLERGVNAGKETWANSVEAAGDHPVLADESERQAARDWLKGFGAWEAEEIAVWSDTELDALVLQYAAGDLRELKSLAPGDGLGNIDWEEARQLSEDGTCNGTLFVHDNGLWISID